MQTTMYLNITKEQKEEFKKLVREKYNLNMSQWITKQVKEELEVKQ